MSASFDNTADRLTYGTYAPPAAGSVSLWWYPTFSITDGAYHFAFSVRNAGSTNYWEFSKNTANRLVFIVGGEPTFSVSPTGFTQNQWNHCLATWDDSANTREIFVGGSSLGTSALAFAIGALSETLHVGNLRSDVASLDARGRIAEFAVWDVVLSAAEISALYKGFCPKLVRPTSLKRYIPLIREICDYKTGATGTNSGVTVETHPPIRYPRGAA